MSDKSIKKLVNGSLVELLENGPATANGLGLRFYERKALLEGGFIKVAGLAKTGQRGRPSHVFKLTDKGRKRAKRAIEVAAQAESANG